MVGELIQYDDPLPPATTDDLRAAFARFLRIDVMTWGNDGMTEWEYLPEKVGDRILGAAENVADAYGALKGEQ